MEEEQFNDCVLTDISIASMEVAMEEQDNDCVLTDSDKLMQLHVFLNEASREIMSKGPFVQSLTPETLKEVGSVVHMESPLANIVQVIMSLVPWKEWVHESNKDGLLHLFGVDPLRERKVVEAVSQLGLLTKAPFKDERTGVVEERPIGEQYAWSIVLVNAYLWKRIREGENLVSKDIIHVCMNHL